MKNGETYITLDCEIVGVGPGIVDSAVACLRMCFELGQQNKENQESSTVSLTTSNPNYDTTNNSMTTESAELLPRTFQTLKETISVNPIYKAIVSCDSICVSVCHNKWVLERGRNK